MWSLISILDEFIIVVLPSICNPPFIITSPVLSPTPAGSIINVDGPLICPVVVKSAHVISDEVIVPNTFRLFPTRTSPFNDVSPCTCNDKSHVISDEVIVPNTFRLFPTRTSPFNDVSPCTCNDKSHVIS